MQGVVVLVALQHEMALGQQAHALQGQAHADDGAMGMTSQFPEAATAGTGGGGKGRVGGATGVSHSRSPRQGR
mgnify:CR=1 FL=1